MKIFILALFVLATSVSMSADCGWVLWEHKTSRSIPLAGRSDEWTISTAVPTFDECKTETTKAVQLIVFVTRTEPKPGKILTERAVVIYSDDREMTLTYICLPGTLDPRPRAN
jgi:hypothetical protein